MITTDTHGGTTTLRVEGELRGEWVEELEYRWRHAGEQKHIQLDLCHAYDIDEQGKNLVSEMFANGVELVVGPRGPHRVQ
jgi:endonuclease IV